jgi:tetratricopeptide (TPR) repeat protein
MKRQALSIALIVVLGFAVYANSLKGAFVWDDEALIEDNLYIKDFKYLPDIFTQDLAKASGKQSGFYRPLQGFSYMLDHRFWGFDVRGYHLTNIFLHILVTLSIFFLVFTLFKDNLLALLAAVLFVVHPVHSEVVAYISGRADSLAALFMLLAFIFYLKNIDVNRISLYLLMVVSYILALLSRENSLILPLAVLFYHYAFRKKVYGQGVISLTVLAFIYIALRLTLLKFMTPQAQATTALLQRLPGFFFALSSYPGLLIFPFGLHMEYTNKLFAWAEPCVLLGLLMAVTSLYVIGKKRENTLLVFSLGWSFIFLVPHSNIYSLTTYMAEHWIYLSSIGFFLVIARAFSRYLRNKRSRLIALSALVALVSCLSILTLRQNTCWQDPLRFYRRTLRYAPESWRVHNNLGKIYRGLGKKDKAAAFYRRALELKPDYPEAHSNLGNIYYEVKDYPKAITAYKKALVLKPDYANAYYNLGNAYYAQGRILEAVVTRR